MSVCDETCRACVYYGSAGSYRTCDHLLITGTVRGCPAGKGCIRRTVGKKIASLDERVFQLPPEKSEPKSVIHTGRRDRQTKEEIAEINRRMHRDRYWLIKKKLAGRQRAALVEFKNQTGHTNRTLALALGLSTNTINGWLQESRTADWPKLAQIGCRRPEGL